MASGSTPDAIPSSRPASRLERGSCRETPFTFRLEVKAETLEGIACRLEVIGCRLEGMTIRSSGIAFTLEGIVSRSSRPAIASSPYAFGGEVFVSGVALRAYGETGMASG